MKNTTIFVYSRILCGTIFQKLALVKSLVSLSLLALVLGFSVKAKANEYTNEAGCLKDDYVASIVKDFDVQFSDSAEDMKIETCNPQSLSYRIIQALLILKYGQYKTGTPSQDQSYENLFATMSPYNFVKRFVRKVKVNDCNRVKFAWAYAIPGDDEINICAKKMLGWDLRSPKKISAVRIASLVVHEVRHLDTKVPMHVTTSQCFGCDANVEAKGSFYYEKEFLYNIHRNGVNFTPAEKNDARFWAEWVLDTNFVKRANLARPLRPGTVKQQAPRP